MLLKYYHTAVYNLFKYITQLILYKYEIYYYGFVRVEGGQSANNIEAYIIIDIML